MLHLFLKIKKMILYIFNLLFLGRDRVKIQTKQFLGFVDALLSENKTTVRVKIRTKQFLGSQENYYMFEQTGHINLITYKFHTDHKTKGSHDVYMHSLKDIKESVVEFL